MAVIDRNLLIDRTAGRNTRTWANMDTGAGYAGELATLEALLNTLGSGKIYQYVVLADEEDSLNNALREKLDDLEYEEAVRKRAQALANYETQRTVLAYKVAGEEYLLAAKEYDATVQALIMTAKEYAAQVEREQIGLEATRAQMAVKKEEARLQEISGLILLEQYNRAQVDVDIARAKLDVSKANTRVVLADIEAEQAELKVIQANLETAMTEAEKATLQADVAMILADIIVRSLTQTKFEVASAEIAAGYNYIASKLADMLEIWGERSIVEQISRDAADSLKLEQDRLLVAQKAQEDLKTTSQAADRDVFNFLYAKQEAIKNLEDDLRELEDNKKRDLASTKTDGRNQIDDTQLWAKRLVNQAQRWVYKNMISQEVERTYYNQIIHQGIITPAIGTLVAGDAVCGALE